MKKIYVCILLLPFCFYTKAQDQVTNNGNLKIFTGASVSFYGNFSNNGTLTDSGQVVTFRGNSNQVISGSAVSTFKRLIIDNSAGITLQQNIAITTSLSLIAGSVSLNSNTLIINNDSPLSVTRNAGFILSENANNSSAMKWNIGAATGNHIFPFGTSASFYIPFSFILTSGNAGNITISTYSTSINNVPYPSTPDLVTNMNNGGGDNSANVVDRFWQITKDGPSGMADLIFIATPSEVGSITNLQAQRWNSISGQWETPLAGQLNTANSVTVPGVTNFSPWTLSGNNSPLPIELLNFSAVAKDKQVDIDWTTASENNCQYFTVEKSKNAMNYEVVSSVNGSGNTSTTSKYAVTDANPYKGISYYRLKQTDFDGKVHYFKICAVEFLGGGETPFVIFPVPCNGSNIKFNVNSAKGEEMTIILEDLSGKIYYSKIIHSEGGACTYSVDPIQKLCAGIYIMNVISNQKIYTNKFIVE